MYISIVVVVVVIIIIIIIITYLLGNFWQCHSEQGQAAKRKPWGLTIYPREVNENNNIRHITIQ